MTLTDHYYKQNDTPDRCSLARSALNIKVCETSPCMNVCPMPLHARLSNQGYMP